MGASFPDRDIAIVAEGLRAGKTASEIAALLPGRSKGSIAGIVFRHPDLRKIGFKRPAPDAFTKQAQQRRALAKKQKGAPPGLRLLAEPVRLIALLSHHCRFPMWDHNEKASADALFCAEVKCEDSSYCEYHRKLCRSLPKGRAA